MNRVTTLPDIEAYENADVIKTVLSAYYRFLVLDISPSMGVFDSFRYTRFSFWLKRHFPAHYDVFGDARDFSSLVLFHWQAYAEAHRFTFSHYRQAAEINTDRITGERVFSDTWEGINTWHMDRSPDPTWRVHEFRPFVWDQELRLYHIRELPLLPND